MARSIYGNRALSSVIINNVPAYNLGSDYAFTLTPADNQSVISVGTNGVMTKFNSDTTAVLEIQLLGNSTTNDYLSELIYNQTRGVGVLIPITCISDVNEILNCSGCSILTAAQIVSGNAEATPRTWRFNVESWVANF